MNKVNFAVPATNRHELMVQVVDATNPSRVLSSPCRLSDLESGLVLQHGRALLITNGEPRSALSVGMGLIGKQEPGTMRAPKPEPEAAAVEQAPEPEQPAKKKRSPRK